VVDREWPALPLDEWRDTYATLHMWAQIVGKVRLKLAPFVNHWWEAALYVSPRGLRTSAIPAAGGLLELELDFVDHALSLQTDAGARRALPLGPRSVAEVYAELLAALRDVGVEVELDPMPKEVPDPIPFDQDRVHHTYVPEQAHRFWQVLARLEPVFERFRGGFLGKASPVHFFWGSFDLCVTRFSGRRAPPRPEVDHITRVAYSHEVISVGFWPGSGNVQEPALYAYAAPEPAGFPEARVPAPAYYNPPTKGFVLPYEAVRRATDPAQAVLEFCQATYDAGATLGGWDRAALERRPRRGPRAA
jgi:hypothetical protein